MSLIEWNESYSVGIKEIDLQHKKLVSYINQLHDAMKNGKSKEIINTILNGLVDYTKDHFNTEEKYMKKFNYIGYVKHKNIHDGFVQKVVMFKSKFDKGTESISIDLMHFLSDWLIKHIKGTDKKYTECFNKHGLS